MLLKAKKLLTSQPLVSKQLTKHLLQWAHTELNFLLTIVWLPHVVHLNMTLVHLLIQLMKQVFVHLFWHEVWVCDQLHKVLDLGHVYIVFHCNLKQLSFRVSEQ